MLYNNISKKAKVFFAALVLILPISSLLFPTISNARRDSFHFPSQRNSNYALFPRVSPPITGPEENVNSSIGRCLASSGDNFLS
jgi:hypothetical protein